MKILISSYLNRVLPGVFPKILCNKNIPSVSYLKNIKCESHFIFASSTAVYSNDSNLMRLLKIHLKFMGNQSWTQKI